MKHMVHVCWVGTTILASVSAMLLACFFGRLFEVAPFLTTFVGFVMAVFVGETVLLRQIRRGSHSGSSHWR